MEIALALNAAAPLGLALGRRRRPRREPVEELGGFLVCALYWDERAGDELDMS